MRPVSRRALRRSSGRVGRRKLREAIDQISRTAERICIENLNHRIDITSGDPVIRRLTDTINDMIARLEKDVRKQAFFVSDASHELRTPIAVIKGYADMLSRWGANDPVVLAESIGAIRIETERMNNLLKTLLLLANGEEGLVTEKTDISLNAVASEAAREMAMVNRSSNIELIEHSQERLSASFDMILQLLRILLDNCVKYAKNKNDPIQIIVSGDADGSYVTVKDYGIGIGEDDLPFVFERFFRADKSHSRRVPGFGLGLAVADMIARAHQATIGVYSEPGAGTEFTVSFPADAPQRTDKY